MESAVGKTEGCASTEEPAAKIEEVAESCARWRVNAPLLYDFFVDVSLEWSALCVAWLPDVDGQLARFAFGTNEGGKKGELVVCEVRAAGEDYIEEDPWRTWTSDIGEISGFGCNPCEGFESPIARLTRLQHPTEVNRVLPCPHTAQLLATKAASGSVLLYDYLRERDSAQCEPDVWLRPPSESEVDGFALNWSSLSKGHLVTGGNDGRCFVWDVNVELKASLLHNFVAHSGALCEATFSRHDSHLLATVGDDRALNIWDLRSLGGKHASVTEASADEVLTVDWSYHSGHFIATAGKDHQVRVWDFRSLRMPYKDLSDHTGDCVAVRWSPQNPNRLASCSSDGTVNVWDLDAQRAAIHDPSDEDGDSPPELLFKHTGHDSGISDISWNPKDDNLLLSVDDGSFLQMWAPQSAFEHSNVDNGDHDDATCLHAPQPKSQSSDCHEGDSSQPQKRQKVTSERGGEAPSCCIA